MPMIQGKFIPAPAHERQRWAVQVEQLRRQIKAQRQLGYRMFHHVQAMRRLHRRKCGLPETGIQGI